MLYRYRHKLQNNHAGSVVITIISTFLNCSLLHYRPNVHGVTVRLIPVPTTVCCSLLQYRPQDHSIVVKTVPIPAVLPRYPRFYRSIRGNPALSSTVRISQRIISTNSDYGWCATVSVYARKKSERWRGGASISVATDASISSSLAVNTPVGSRPTHYTRTAHLKV